MRAKSYLCLSLLLFASALSFAQDVKKDHWSYEALEHVAEKGILKDSKERFDGTQTVTKAELVYALSRTLKLVELEKASQSDIKVLEALILQYSDELNRIGFDTKMFDSKLENIYDSNQILQERINENEKKIEELWKRIEKLEKRR